MLRRHPDVWAAYHGQGPRDLAPMCWPPISYFSSRHLWTPQSRKRAALDQILGTVASSQLSRNGCGQSLSQASSGLVCGLLRTSDHSTHTHCVGHGGMSLGLLDGDRQTERQVLTPTVLCFTSSAREGPDLDGPGKDRQERQRARVDSESLDDEDS